MTLTDEKQNSATTMVLPHKEKERLAEIVNAVIRMKRTEGTSGSSHLKESIGFSRRRRKNVKPRIRTIVKQ